MSLFLKNANYLDYRTLKITKTNLLVESGTNGGIYFREEDERSARHKGEIIDCEGKIVTKSFAVGHHHAYSALARGMDAPAKNPENFYEILKYIWWKLDKSLDREMIEASALSTAIACVKSGSTFVIDHHASPGFIPGSLEIIAKAFDKVGINHLLCYEISDRDGMEKAEEGLEETAKYLSHRQGLVGLHASFTVGNNTMKKAADLMQKFHTGFHIHVAEAPYDQEVTKRKYGVSVVERLKDFGALNTSKTILAHCLHLSNKEKELVRESKAWVVQNPDSNLNNHVGFFDGRDLGKRIMLGTDGMHSDMIQSAQQAYLLGQTFDSIGMDSAYQRFRNVHEYLNVNNLEGDSENNLVVLDYKSPTPVKSENFTGHFVYGLRASDVLHVIANGKLIMRDRHIETVDEDEVLAFSKEQALWLWRRMRL